MNFFQAAAAMFGAAQRATTQAPSRGHAAPQQPEGQCTPCSADAYATQSAEAVRAMFGGAAQRSKKSRSRR